MELTHTFTVPVDRPTAWAAFQDVASVAECFPGATVTSSDGDSFQGTVKVKLGPVALQYAGSGEFVERDESAYRLVIEAKGRDKRGNGTAGADVTASFAEEGTSTRIEVMTELQITGKPAQFGRGVIQDVSDKILGQFLDCLEQRLSPAPAPTAPAPAESSQPPATAPAESSQPPATAPAESSQPPDQVPLATGPVGRPSGGDAIDLGTTVLPVLLKSYAKPVPAAVGVLLVLVLLLRRMRRP